jgi:DNA-binding response OmpR family regulator
MTQTKTSVSHRVLLVDDDEGVRNMMRASLEGRGFDVIPATGVTQALKLIAAESFDVLITDLHMPNPSDGVAVVTAMRRSQPDVLRLLVSGYPYVKSEMDAIVLEADEILVKPFDLGKLADLVREKMLTRKPPARTGIALPVYEASRAKEHAAASQHPYITERLRFITHGGKQILLIDLSNCSAAQVETTFRAVPELVTTRPRGSVLILTDFKGASFDQEAIRVMKETAVFDKPYVKKSAWAGAENFPPVLSANLSSFSRREFPAFKTREEALAWLTKD